MEIKLNIPDWIKIPLNILLPAVWLTCGTLLLLPEKLLIKFFILNWRNEQGFIIGLTFIISSFLLLVYLLFFLNKVISTVFYNFTYKRKTMKEISKMNDIEQEIIIKLYNSPGYTCELDLNQPLIQGLLVRNYIYIGGQQHVTLDLYSNCIPAKATLQPVVYQTLNYYRPKLQKYIKKIKKRINNTTDANKKEKLKSELLTIENNYNYVYGGRVNG